MRVLLFLLVFLLSTLALLVFDVAHASPSEIHRPAIHYVVTANDELPDGDGVPINREGGGGGCQGHPTSLG